MIAGMQATRIPEIRKNPGFLQPTAARRGPGTRAKLDTVQSGGFGAPNGLYPL
jgi:hypothetical protein